jgi:hypothetical protein
VADSLFKDDLPVCLLILFCEEHAATSLQQFRMIAEQLGWGEQATIPK